MVRLDIFEEVSALVANALVNAAQLGPVTTIRSATTSVVVRDKQTVVIGGLISDGTDNSENSVPFISDIPVIGNLFRSTSGHREKINLLIFLTPHIIRDAAEHRDKSLEERDKLKAFMEERGIRYRKRKILDAPSWTPDIPKDGETTDTTEDRAKGATIYRPPALPGAGAGTTQASTEPAGQQMAAIDVTRPAVESIRDEGQPALPRPLARYVLLAAFAELGTPPPGLQSNSGLVAVELPENSQSVDPLPGRHPISVHQRQVRGLLPRSGSVSDRARGPAGLPGRPAGRRRQGRLPALANARRLNLR